MKRTSIEELGEELKKVEKEYKEAKARVEELKKDLYQRRETLRYLIGKKKGKECPACKPWNSIYRCYARKGFQVAPSREAIYSYYCYKCRFTEDEIRLRLLAYKLGDKE